MRVNSPQRIYDRSVSARLLRTSPRRFKKPSRVSSLYVCQRHLLQRYLSICLLVFGFFIGDKIHAKDWEFCPAPFLAPSKPVTDPPPKESETYELSADSADLNDDLSILKGNAQVLTSTWLLTTDTLRHKEADKKIGALGNVEYWNNRFYIKGDTAQIQTDQDIIDLQNIEFVNEANHERGAAKHAQRIGKDQLKIQGVTNYTTCLPGNEDWELKTDSLELDYLKNTGTARNTKVYFKGVPVLYSPYFSFPLKNIRKSGFLSPNTRISDATGYELSIPYYFNLAPSHDATLTTRITTLRGPIFGGEYRYLRPWGDGEVDVEVAPNDLERGGPRGRFRLQHRGSFTPGWNIDLDYNQVSDKDYFDEINHDPSLSNTPHLRRRISLQYNAPLWEIRGRIESYQTIDPSIIDSERPYRRLPQFLFYSRLPKIDNQLYFNTEVEFVHFERKNSVTGSRVDIRPSVSYPMRRSWGFIEPGLGVRHTAYELENNTLGGNSLSRTTMHFSTDAGLYFEQPSPWESRRFTQTLEPRLFYLARPFVDQSDIPLFDTGEFTFNFAQLLRTDRFNGPDRVGDAHQISTEITSRLLSNKNGQEVLRARFGRTAYFRDRRVQLPTSSVQTTNFTPYIFELASSSGPLTFTADAQWDTENDHGDRGSISARYQPKPDRVINISYRFQENITEEADLSFRWPWSTQLSVVGRYNYSLLSQQTLDVFSGIEYENCCWSVRTLLRRFLLNDSNKYNHGAFIQLELKGLTHIGQKADTFLSKTIPGYRNNF